MSETVNLEICGKCVYKIVITMYFSTIGDRRHLTILYNSIMIFLNGELPALQREHHEGLQ